MLGNTLYGCPLYKAIMYENYAISINYKNEKNVEIIV